MTDKKYRTEPEGDLLRIYALRHITPAVRDDYGVPVEAGEMGGLIASEDNLSHDGECWVEQEAMAVDASRVAGNARIAQHSIVSGEAEVWDDAVVLGESTVVGNARVSESATVDGCAVVTGSARVEGSAIIDGYAAISDQAILSGRAIADGYSRIEGTAQVCHDAEVSGYATVGGTACLGVNAWVGGWDEIVKGTVGEEASVENISSRDMPRGTTTTDPSHFVDAMGTTYQIEPVAATHIDDGLHAVPNVLNELLVDPIESTLVAHAIEVRISKKCWKIHCKRRLPGGKLISESKHTVHILVTYDDITSILDTVRWIRYDPSSPAINPFEEQKHAAMLLRKAALQLDGRLHRILIAWDETLSDSIDVDEVAKEVNADSSSGDAGSIELSRQHHADLAAGLTVTVSLTEGASMLLEEIGVEPDHLHPDAPNWGPGKHKVTSSILDDLEQRSANIIDPVALESWKKAMLDKQGGGRSVHLESAKKYGWGGIVNSQVASVGKGLARQIAKARAELDKLSEESL